MEFGIFGLIWVLHVSDYSFSANHTMCLVVATARKSLGGQNMESLLNQRPIPCACDDVAVWESNLPKTVQGLRARNGKVCLDVGLMVPKTANY